MSAPAFTPGPWEVHGGNMLVRKCEGDFCQAIADMRPPYKQGVGLVRGEQQQWANARLIAAAPELYEAALLVVNDPASVTNLEILAAALAKARGDE